MTTRAERYSLHYRITGIERTLGIVNKWTSMPEGADIHSKEDGQRLNERADVYFPDADPRTDEQKQPGPNYVPLGGAGNGG